MATGIIDQLKDKLILKRFVFGYGGSISAGSAKRLLARDVGYSIPAGYYPVGVTTFTTGHNNLVLDYLQLQSTDSDYFIAVKNVHSSSSASTSSAEINVLFAPEWMVELISADESAKPKSDIQAEPVFKIANFTCAYSNLATNGGAKAFTRSEMGLFVPEGYEIFSLRNFGPGVFRVSVSDCDPFSESRMLTIRNMSTTAATSTVDMGVVFINRKYMQPDPRKGLIIYYNNPTTVPGDYSFALTNFSPSPSHIEVSNGIPIFPSSHIRENENLLFSIYRPEVEQPGRYVPPTKSEVIAGAEYVTFLNGTCYRFTISEDWTDKQIIIKFTFD